ncbi:MAG: phosphoribulokinase [Halofilum sp. (in: g-proteobacteria)]|nr:phosphoribulokinase [Halofilum sp. (in: g-proteobacteria)]
MSLQHPIIAVTGSSGAGTSTVRTAFEGIFRRHDVTPVYIQGDSFHRYSREEMVEQIRRAQAEGEVLSHFGPAGNQFDQLEALFREYGESGTGWRRLYLHNAEEAARYGGDASEGEFTPWERLPEGSDVLFYEGLHGGVVTSEHDIAQHVDFLVGVTPIVNLEWIQKIHRDAGTRGYAPEDTVETIKRRMHDYVEYITPQFSRTDINFQRVPLVDTSNPFVAHEVPSADESLVVIRFGDAMKAHVDFPYLLTMLTDSFMSRPNTIVIPGGKLGFAMEMILAPFIRRLIRGERIREKDSGTANERE